MYIYIYIKYPAIFMVKKATDTKHRQKIVLKFIQGVTLNFYPRNFYWVSSELQIMAGYQSLPAILCFMSYLSVY